MKSAPSILQGRRPMAKMIFSLGFWMTIVLFVALGYAFDRAWGSECPDSLNCGFQHVAFASSDSSVDNPHFENDLGASDVDRRRRCAANATSRTATIPTSSSRQSASRCADLRSRILADANAPSSASEPLSGSDRNPASLKNLPSGTGFSLWSSVLDLHGPENHRLKPVPPFSCIMKPDSARTGEVLQSSSATEKIEERNDDADDQV